MDEELLELPPEEELPQLHPPLLLELTELELLLEEELWPPPQLQPPPELFELALLCEEPCPPWPELLL